MITFQEFKESVQSNMLIKFKQQHPDAKEKFVDIHLLKNKIEGWIKNNYDMNHQDKEKVDSYVKLDPKTAQPILIQDWGNNDLSIIDGWHRLAAAYLRKDKTIRALVTE